MPNPILPAYEYIPDGEPRVFGDRVYLYGSHDNAGSDRFCDFKYYVWSAPLNDLDNWRNEGISFSTRTVAGHGADVDWTDNYLFAPDVVEKDDRYYLYFYIVGAPGGVAVSDTPSGPFELVSRYKIPEGLPPEKVDNGIFIDPGVLVDNDGSVYIYCGYKRSYMAEIDPENMYEILPGSYKGDIIPTTEPYNFFEAASMRKVGDTYYLIYSPGSQLAYATSSSPTGPFEYGGIIVDNAIDYPGGNNHGSICEINGQWYIFYHRMTNNTVFSRRACVERIEIREDGSIPQVEMTSLGFSKVLNPYQWTSADIACILKGGNYITEYDHQTHPVIENRNNSIIGFKYFDFGEEAGSVKFSTRVKMGKASGFMEIRIDDESNGELLAVLDLNGPNSESWELITTKVKGVIGVHPLYFKFISSEEDVIAEIESFYFEKV